MSNDEYTHQNFWKANPKYITIEGKSIRVHFVPNPLFDETFCKQIKKKKHDKNI